MKVTFRKHPRATGNAGIGYPYQGSDIKFNGKIVGVINSPNWRRDGWGIQFTVADSANSNPNCAWRWAFFSGGMESEEVAKQWVRDNVEQLKRQYHFWVIDDGKEFEVES